MILSPEQNGLEQGHDDERQLRREGKAEHDGHRHAGQSRECQDRHEREAQLEQEQANGYVGRLARLAARAALHPARAADSTRATVARRWRPEPFGPLRPAPGYSPVMACWHILNGERESEVCPSRREAARSNRPKWARRTSTIAALSDSDASWKRRSAHSGPNIGDDVGAGNRRVAPATQRQATRAERT